MHTPLRHNIIVRLANNFDSINENNLRWQDGKMFGAPSERVYSIVLQRLKIFSPLDPFVCFEFQNCKQFSLHTVSVIAS